MKKKISQSDQLDLFEKIKTEERFVEHISNGAIVIGLYDKNLQAFVFVDMAEFNEFEANHDNNKNTDKVIEDFLKIHEVIRMFKAVLPDSTYTDSTE